MIISVLSLAGCWSSTPEVVTPPPVVEHPRKNAVVLVIDTLRADEVLAADTPALDAVIAKGQSVTNCWAAGTWTVPSVTSMFSGLSVRQHGWDLAAAQMGRYPPLPTVPFLAQVLHDAGFKTAGMYSNPYLAEPIGFDRGFDAWTRIADRAAGLKVKKEIEGWNDGSRHFLYIHLLGPHSALKPSEAEMTKYGIDPEVIDPRIGFDVGAPKRNQEPGVQDAYKLAYRAMVEDTDQIVGQITDALAPVQDDTVLLITSDHGEFLGEHDQWGHGTFVWQPLIHVPMIGVGTGTLPDTITNAAVPDIVTSSLGIDHDWPTKRSDTGPWETEREGKIAFSQDGHTVAVWDAKDATTPQVFDVASDPGEKTPITTGVDAIVAARQAWEAKIPAGVPAAATVPENPETTQQLQQFGYVKPGTPAPASASAPAAPPP